MRAVVAMSGGVDSSVAAYLLKKQGFKVTGLSFELWDKRDVKNLDVCCSIETVEIAKAVARKLGIEHYTVDIRDAFYRDVIENFCSSYIDGITPNPCILCNKYIKFNLLLKKAEEMGAEIIATGHYARIINSSEFGDFGEPFGSELRPATSPSAVSSGLRRAQSNRSNCSVESVELLSQVVRGSELRDKKPSLVTRHPAPYATGRHLLLKGVDHKKDQSYVLYVMTQEELSKTLFPLGEFKKEKTRDIAKELGLANALRPESQEICFIGNENYVDFIKGFAPEAVQSGPIVNMEGKTVGTHKGIAFYTIGQRKRLGIQTLKPCYVVDIDRQRNAIIIGTREDAMKKTFKVTALNWGSIESLSEPVRAQVKVRSTMKEEPSIIIPEGNHTVLVEFDKPQWAPAPGQSAVFYNGDVVIGGGIIE